MVTIDKKEVRVVFFTVLTVALLILGSVIIDFNFYDVLYLIACVLFLVRYMYLVNKNQ